MRPVRCKPFKKFSSMIMNPGFVPQVHLLKFVLLLVDRRAPVSQALALVQMPNGAVICVGYKRDWGTRNLVSDHQR